MILVDEKSLKKYRNSLPHLMESVAAFALIEENIEHL